MPPELRCIFQYLSPQNPVINPFSGQKNRIMKKSIASLCALFFIGTALSWAQGLDLPADFRQHNITQFNASLFNPAYSIDRDDPASLSVWSRWQWQMIDADFTTLYANYTQQLGERAAFGVGFLQHSTGIFNSRGGVLNFAYAFPLGENSQLILATNVIGTNKELDDAEDRFFPDSALDLPALEATTGFVFAVNPGIRLKLNRFDLALSSEMAYDYNFTTEARETNDMQRIFAGAMSYEFPVGGNGSFLRPLAYARYSEVMDVSYGGTLLFSAPKFWLQGGYNDFYGASGGAGVTLFGKWSIGGLVEFGIDSPVSDADPTIELVTSYKFGARTPKVKKEEEDQEELDRIARAEEDARRREEERQKAIAKQDSIYQARLAEQRRLDSIARAQRDAEELDLRPEEKYEEVTNADGLAPGYYLIANVFATQKYFERFMTRLQREGLDPKSFYRGLNGYNYVYLDRFNTLSEAREARDTQYFGRYFDETWIFRVRQ